MELAQKYQGQTVCFEDDSRSLQIEPHRPKRSTF